MRRRRIAISVMAAAAAVTLMPATSAAALPITTSATAYSAPAGTGTASLAAQLSLTGAVGGLLNGLISPIVNGVLNPLVSALQGTLNTAVGSTLGASGNLNVGQQEISAQSGPAPAAFPGDLPAGLPSPCSSASGPQPCYNAANGITPLSLPTLVSLGLNTLSGYVQQVPASIDTTNPIFARSQVSSPTVAVLPGITQLVPGLPNVINPLVSVGTVDAKANCPNDGTTAPTASVSAAAVNLLGGLVRLDVLNGKIANLTVNGTSYGVLSALPVLNIANVIVQPFGSSVKITIPLTLTQLVNGLGLPGSVISGLLGDTTGASLNLSLVIGPNSKVTSTSASAWGLGIGVDLSGQIGFNLLGLVGATVTLPSGIGGGNYGNLLDARLAYASCTTGGGGGPTGSPPAVPPALI